MNLKSCTEKIYIYCKDLIGLVTLNWTVFKRTVTIENQEMR